MEVFEAEIQIRNKTKNYQIIVSPSLTESVSNGFIPVTPAVRALSGHWANIV